MHLTPFWIYTITGILAGWPPAVAGMWLTWKLAKKQVTKAMTEANDVQLAKLTAQTRTQVITALARQARDTPPPV